MQEALRIMEVYRRDFEMLIKRIETQQAFESATDQDSRLVRINCDLEGLKVQSLPTQVAM